jgi:Na+/H+ antiporter NhaD/arsenite permease-like protein
MPSILAAATENLSLLWSIPFLLLLACAAIVPLISQTFWHKSYAWISIALGLVTALYYFVIAPSASSWAQEMQEYVSFIALLASLYIVSGGIYISVARKATPLANCLLLLTGAVMANIVGTTGAAMLLIRPFLRMNADHIRPFHVVFFIFVVANVGGALTPIGDPPLFLGYLYDVPFWWVLQHTYDAWLLAVGLLIAVFFVLDMREYRKFARSAPTTGHQQTTIKLIGAGNFLFIGIILVAVFREGVFEQFAAMSEQGFSLRLAGKMVLSREVLMVMATVASKIFTHDEPYRRNEFSYAAIKEVAILFLGIFSTMTPALQWLQANAERMPLKSPGQYYFTCGALSSFLDNAPTYLTFLQTELGAIDQDQVDRAVEELQQMKARQSLVGPDTPESPQVAQAVQAMVKYHPDQVLSGKLTRAQIEVGFLIGVP